MSSNARGTLFVISGPSGSGKGTILKEILARRSDLFVSVSATTREPRPGEQEGVSYFFVTRERFLEMIEGGEVLEHASYCGNYYGTPRAEVQKRLDSGVDVILEIEVQGAMQIKKSMPEAVLIFVTPPTPEVLRARLTGRGTESPQVIEKRIETARREYSFIDLYDYVVINDELEKAADDMLAVLRAGALRAGAAGRAVKESFGMN